jgi:hypothetical protein
VGRREERKVQRGEEMERKGKEKGEERRQCFSLSKLTEDCYSHYPNNPYKVIRKHTEPYRKTEDVNR